MAMLFFIIDNNILSKSISNINFNLYDNENIIIPFQSGHIVKVSMFDQNIDISQIQVEAGPLSDLKSADFNQDGYIDLILISGEPEKCALKSQDCLSCQ